MMSKKFGMYGGIRFKILEIKATAIQTTNEYNLQSQSENIINLETINAPEMFSEYITKEHQKNSMKIMVH